MFRTAFMQATQVVPAGGNASTNDCLVIGNRIHGGSFKLLAKEQMASRIRLELIRTSLDQPSGRIVSVIAVERSRFNASEDEKEEDCNPHASC